MASGVPVVASAVGGIPEAVVDEETGLLVEPNDVDALAAALRRMLEDGDVRERFGAAGRARALELFSWQSISREVARVYFDEFAKRTLIQAGPACIAAGHLPCGSPSPIPKLLSVLPVALCNPGTTRWSPPDLSGGRHLGRTRDACEQGRSKTSSAAPPPIVRAHELDRHLHRTKPRCFPKGR